MTSSQEAVSQPPTASTSSTPTATKAREVPTTTHPTFAIIKQKSIGTIMHELWIRYQGEFALSMLETWEVVMLHVILLFMLSFLWMAVFQYFPSHVKVIASRARYYLSGQE